MGRFKKNEIWKIPGIDFSCNKTIKEEKTRISLNSMKEKHEYLNHWQILLVQVMQTVEENISINTYCSN